MELEDEAELVVAERGALVVVERRGAAPSTSTAPARRPVERAEQVEQRPLARARAPVRATNCPRRPTTSSLAGCGWRCRRRRAALDARALERCSSAHAPQHVHRLGRGRPRTTAGSSATSRGRRCEPRGPAVVPYSTCMIDVVGLDQAFEVDRHALDAPPATAPRPTDERAGQAHQEPCTRKMRRICRRVSPIDAGWRCRASSRARS